MLTVPASPEIADGGALERREERKRNASHGIEDDSPPQQLPSRARKDLEIEEQERHLEKHELEEVHDLHDIKEVAEACDAVERQRPDVLAFPISGRANDVHGSRGQPAGK